MVVVSNERSAKSLCYLAARDRLSAFDRNAGCVLATEAIAFQSLPNYLTFAPVK